jgi:hypothetical protein
VVPHVASSSRSQIAVRTARAAVRLIWERPSVNVRQRLVVNVPIVTQLVTRLAIESVRGFGPRLVRGRVIPCLQSMAKMSSTVHGLARGAPQRPAEYNNVQTCWCRLWVLPRLTDGHLGAEEVRAGISALDMGGIGARMIRGPVVAVGHRGLSSTRKAQGSQPCAGDATACRSSQHALRRDSKLNYRRVANTWETIISRICHLMTLNC